MGIKIAVITTKYLYDYIKGVLKDISEDYEFILVEYTSFEDISKAYISLQDSVDGYLVTGNVAKRVIDEDLPNHSKPIMWIGADLLSLYRVLINCLLKNRSLDSKNVIADFLIPIRENPSYIHLLEDKNLERVKVDFEAWLNNTTVEALRDIEKTIKIKIKELWDTGSLEFVVCTFSSIFPYLEENKIPATMALPEKESIKDSLDKLINSIRINKMTNNLPAVISISKRSRRVNDDTDFDRISLQKSLLDFNKENITEFLVQGSSDGVDVYTSMQVVNQLTENMQICRLSLYLQEQLSFKVNVGYGIGNNINDAKAKALEAKKESIAKDGSYILDRNNCLIGPLNTDHSIRIINISTPEAQRVAEESKLSILTIQKLYTIIESSGTNKMTTQDLAQKLNVTVRNANRILNNLEKGGFASVVSNNSRKTKGRPLKVYEIKLD